MSHHGIGLRTQHFSTVLQQGLPVELVEVISENFMGRGGRPLAVLERVRRDSRIVLHGVSMSLGGLDPFPEAYFQRLTELASRFEVAWVSDHLCFGTVGGHSGHDLWPLPYTEEALNHVVARIGEAQDRLGRRLVVENVSSYVEYSASTMSEWEFIGEVLQQADCELLLDLNNLYVNAINHAYEPYAALQSIVTRRIRQIHLAGYSDEGDYLFDTHGAPVAPPVWRLYERCVQLHGAIPSIIEWDENVPPLDQVLAESERAEALERRNEGREAMGVHR